MENKKFYINNSDAIKEIAENIFLDIHGNVFIFDTEAYISSYEDDGPNLRVLKHPNKFTTVIINIEDAYRHLFGGDEKPEITVICNACDASDAKIEEKKIEEKQTPKLGSDAWIKDPHARYNYRALKDAYIAVIKDKWTMTDAAEAAGIKISTLSQMCCKKIHVAFTDALDEEYGLTPHNYKRRNHRNSTEKMMENVYIEHYIMHISQEALSAKYKISISTVDRIIKGTTQKSRRMIEELTRSGRFAEAKKKFEASKEEVNEIA